MLAKLPDSTKLAHVLLRLKRRRFTVHTAIENTDARKITMWFKAKDVYHVALGEDELETPWALTFDEARGKIVEVRIFHGDLVKKKFEEWGVEEGVGA